MAVVTELALLSAWESAYGRPGPDRAIALAAAVSGLPAQGVADLPLGRCDLLLLELREQCFGPRLDGLARCPRCGIELDVRIDVGELRVPAGEGDAGEGDPAVEVGGRAVRLRALTNRDLRSAGGDRDRLLAQCIVGQGIVGEPAVPAPDLLDAIEARLDALDPQAASTVDLDCPSCQTDWPASIDITEFVWSEVDRFARRLLYDVHTLATAYGWREPDVLAISPARRRFYLEACGS